MIRRTVNNFKACAECFKKKISHLSSPYNKSTLCLSQQKAYVISILWGCIFGKANKMLSLPLPGLTRKRQSVTCQMNPNWLTGLSFMASLHLHVKTGALICREVRHDIEFRVQELREEHQHIRQICASQDLPRETSSKNTPPAWEAEGITPIKSYTRHTSEKSFDKCTEENEILCIKEVYINHSEGCPTVFFSFFF